MKIEVLLFAQLKEACGSAQLSLEVPGDAKVSDVVRIVLSKASLQAFRKLPLRYAVNEEFQPAETSLRNHDCIAILSPVAGG